jgi:hypothetical protein
MSASERSAQPPTITSDRRQRAVRLFVAVITSAIAAVLALVLAIAGVVDIAVPVAIAVLAVACFILFRRTVSPRSRY